MAGYPEQCARTLRYGRRVGASSEDPIALNFNKVCGIEDFSDPELVAVMRDVAAHKLDAFPGFPKGAEHRKDWEVAMAVRALRDHGALRPDATLLGVAAGTEDTLFYLTRHVRQVFATDLYAASGDWVPMAPRSMLIDPALVAPYEFDANRLVVQHMDARALRYPDDTFDGIFSSGSIEHVGDLADVANVAYEMGRVLKPGGVLSVSTELRLDGPEDGIGWPGETLVFPREALSRYVIEASGLEPVDELDTEVSPDTLATRRDLTAALAFYRARLSEGAPEHASWEFPYVTVDHEGYAFTSVHLTLVKTDHYPAADNGWARPSADTLGAVERDNRTAVGRDQREVQAELDAWKDAHRLQQLERVELEAERDAWKEAHRSTLVERGALEAERDAWMAAHENLLVDRAALVAERDSLVAAHGALEAQRQAEQQAHATERDALAGELRALSQTVTFRARARLLAMPLVAGAARWLLRSGRALVRRSGKGG